MMPYTQGGKCESQQIVTLIEKDHTDTPSVTFCKNHLSSLSDVCRQAVTGQQLWVKTSCKHLQHASFLVGRQLVVLKNEFLGYLSDKRERLQTCSLWVTRGDVNHLLKWLLGSLCPHRIKKNIKVVMEI